MMPRWWATASASAALAQQGQRLLEAHGLAREALGQVLPLQPLHGEEGPAVRGGAMGDVGDDAGVAQLGQDGGLASEALEGLGALGVEQLERHGLTGDRVAGAIDGAHAATAHEGREREAPGDDRVHLELGGRD